MAMPWLVAAAVGCAQVDRVELDVDGVARSYFERVPEGLAAGAPVVLVFHGGGTASNSAGRQMVRFTGFGDLAEREGFVAVFPNALHGNWNDGRGVSDSDDLAYVDAVLDRVLAETGADPARVFATGISNGGFFSQRLACDRADRFAAVASVASTIPTELACAPAQPVRVMLVPGTEDPLVPHDGGVVAGDRGTCASVDDTVAGWIARNACAEPAVPVDRADIDPADGTTVREQVWCGGGAGEVRLLDVIGGGHTWPGGSQYLPVALVGRVSHELDATEEIWRWFAASP